MCKALRVLQRAAGKLTYANVVATLALFLTLSTGVVWAGGKVGTRKLKAGSVTTGKLARNAVTAVKIRPNAVVAEKIKPGAVDISKLAVGTNLVGSGAGGPVAANSAAAVAVPLTGLTSYAPQPGTISLLSFEASGSLARAGEEDCAVTVQPLVNGSPWNGIEGPLTLRATKPTADFPTGQTPTAGFTAPLGLSAPTRSQTVAVKVIGDPACTAGSTVSVAFAVTRAK